MVDRQGSPVRGLLLSCHPLPTVGVTAVTAGLGLSAGLGPGRIVLLTAAVFTGQLSIGWSNDRLDAARDRAVGRADKPAARGAVPLPVVTTAAALALVATVGLSVPLGAGGAAALVLVASGWAYNLGLKATALSFLPYLTGFGFLPAAATLSATPPYWPGWWAMTAGALLGLAAHLANVLPDLRDDAATGVRGLPHRWGMRVTAIGVPVVLAAAGAVLVVGGGASGPVRLVGGVAIAVAVGAVAVAGFRNPEGRALFVGTLVVAALDLALFALGAP
ncbi:hypothetical protein GIS00_17900 [Nakamurella sp. YIM 132087]|uniref:Ubiquinone biosynthesis protein UbiA n=1 Tax=Nakamurella alba TaxID=2665158 RepID=A0A7K1FNR8_9ACTN|nr:hypothetical protein [Nakamurella alba]